LDWYRRQFSAADADIRAVGEASTSYTKYPRYQGAAERIGRHLPDARLIYVVRDPFERIRSHYQHNVAIGQEERPIDEAVNLNPVYVDYSRYAMQFERYLQHFDRSRMLLLTSEDLRFKRDETIRNVLAFIGVDEDLTIDNLDEEFYRTQDRPAYGRLLGSTRRMLKERFPGAVGLWRGRFLPPWLKRRLGRPVKSESGLSQVAMSDATRTSIARELRDDVKRLRGYVGTEFDGWGIA
jgi:hypothetical protein